VPTETSQPREPRTQPTSVALTKTGRDWVESIAAAHHVTASVVLRTALACAAKHPDEFAKMLDDVGRF
jgi:hypothetical protein